MELKYSEEEVARAGVYFDEVVQSIMAKDFRVKTPPNTEKVCKECDFRFYCSKNGIIIFKTKELMKV